MNYTIPDTFPTLQAFSLEILKAIFPDLEKPSSPYDRACETAFSDPKKEKDNSGYRYTNACNEAANALDLNCCAIDENSSLFRLAYAQSLFYTQFSKKKYDVLKNFRTDFDAAITSFCVPEKRTLSKWLDGKSTHTNLSFAAALFFTYLLLNREEAAAKVNDFLLSCLKHLGVSDIDEAVLFRLQDFCWPQSTGAAVLGAKEPHRLNSKGILKKP